MSDNQAPPPTDESSSSQPITMSSKEETSTQIDNDISNISSGNHNDDVDTLMKYLSETCGLENPQSVICLDDIDESSKTLLLQLCQKSTGVDHSCNVVNNFKTESDEPEPDSLPIIGIQMTNRDNEEETQASTSLTEKVENDLSKIQCTTTATVETTDKVEIVSKSSTPLLSVGRNDTTTNIKETTSSSNKTDSTNHDLKYPPLSFTTTIATTTTTNVDYNDDEILYKQLLNSSTLKDEPWTKALINKIQQQDKTIRQCQEEIKLLYQMIELLRQRSNDDLLGAKRIHELLDKFTEPASEQQPTTPVLRTIQPPPTQQQKPDAGNENKKQFFILSFLEAIVNIIFYIPRSVYKYISTSRPARFIMLVQKESETFRLPGGRPIRFIDWGLLIKTILVSFIFVKRMQQSSMKNNNRGEYYPTNNYILRSIIRFWRTNRIPIFLVSALISYLFQTGVGLFVYHIVVKKKLFGHVWRNEDLKEQEKTNESQQQLVVPEQPVILPNNDGELHAGRRRGRRDRVPLDIHDLPAVGDEPPVDNNNGDENTVQNVHQEEDAKEKESHEQSQNNEDPSVQNQTNHNDNHQGLLNIFNQIHDTIFSGAILKRMRNENTTVNRHNDEGGRQDEDNEENIFLWMTDLLLDVLYFIGTLFLSLFPMWHPHVAQLAEDDNTDVRGRRLNNHQGDNNNGGANLEARNQDNNALEQQQGDD